MLINLINKLYDALARRSQREEVAEVLTELVNYTKTHFAVEETLMRIFGYERYEEHKTGIKKHWLRKFW